MASRRLTLPIFCCVLACGSGRSVDAAEYPPRASLEEVRAAVDGIAPVHPRLLASPGDFEKLRESLAADPLKKKLADAVIALANALEKVPPVERKLQGKRLLEQSRRCVKRVITLAMAYHLTGDAKYLRRCEKEMLAAARFSDWNPSHFLDTAEMTFALAIGYDWLFDQLSESARKEIREAIVKKGVELPFVSRHKGWVRATNNWGQVCHGGLTAGALAVAEDEPELAAKTVHNALRNVTRSIDVFAPHGSYPEGPGYWSYGTTYNVLLVAVLGSALGVDFGLSDAPGFDETGAYLPMVTGPSGETFNYADGGASRHPAAALFWFADRYSRPDWLREEGELLEGALNGLSRDTKSSRGRFLPLALLWMKPADSDAKTKLPLHWNPGGSVPITIHRSSWTEPGASFLGLKAGAPNANHGQMDSGSFVFDADGVRWAMDLGAEGYHGIESRGMSLWSRDQKSDRWKIFRQQNHGHNTLVIDGQLQVAAGRTEIDNFSDAPEGAFTVIDMSPNYAGQAKLVRRGAVMLPGGVVLIRDELEGLKPGSKVRWGMITRGEPGELGSRQLTLKQSGKTLDLRISAAGAKWQVIDTETPREEWDSPNKGTRMVAFELEAPSSGVLSYSVLLSPGEYREGAVGTWGAKRLADW